MKVPYITDSGLPIHKISEPEQRGYMAALSVEDRNSVIEHANALAARIFTISSARAELRKKSRELLKMPSNSTPEQRTELFKELETLRDQYLEMGEQVEKMKATEYTTDKDKNLVIPPIPRPKA